MPFGFDTKIQRYVTVGENQFAAVIRIKTETSATLLDWFSQFARLSGTTWRVNKTYVYDETSGGCNQFRVSLIL